MENQRCNESRVNGSNNAWDPKSDSDLFPHGPLGKRRGDDDSGLPKKKRKKTGTSPANGYGRLLKVYDEAIQTDTISKAARKVKERFDVHGARDSPFRC